MEKDNPNKDSSPYSAVNSKNSLDSVSNHRPSSNQPSVSVSPTPTKELGNPKINAEVKQTIHPPKEPILKRVADYILSGKTKNIIFLIGAGFSTSSGIPDFRSPDTGIYANLSKFDFKFSESIFDIESFRDDPKPIYSLFQAYMPKVLDAKPTFSHYFLKLVADKNLLLRVYTQNIDGLEKKAGLDQKYLIEAHGSLSGASCSKCHQAASIEILKEKIIDGVVFYCSKCFGPIKPNVIFFGEDLPRIFYESLENDCQNCDLLIVAGTSLLVYPVNIITQIISPNVPRVILNKEKIGEFLMGGNFSSNLTEFPSDQEEFSDFTETSSSELNRGNDEKSKINHKICDFGISNQDVSWLGNCDDGFLELATHLGWEKDLLNMVKMG